MIIKIEVLKQFLPLIIIFAIFYFILIRPLQQKKKNISEITQELQTLKTKISELPGQYPAGGFSFGSGAGQAQEQIPIICRNIDEAITSLNTGLDPYNRPITKPQIADGLKRLVNATQKSAFIGLMTAVLSGDGIQSLENHLNDLERIANRIS